jgi:hypothetical protein
MKMLVDVIVSGGQTGADIAGLIAAKSLGIQTGGWAPKGYRTENGDNPDLGEMYGLKEDESDQYPPRTMKNIDDSDGTICFLFRHSSGTEHTIGYCHTKTWCIRKTSKMDGYRPVLVVSKITEKTVEDIRSFIFENNIRVLNIAGHRESTFRGIQNKVVDILLKSLI